MTTNVPKAFTQEAEAFRTYCQRVFKAKLDYHFDSVAIVDGILGECYEGLKGMNEMEAWTYLNNITVAAGSFLGEVLLRNARGAWTHAGDANQLQNWAVHVPANGSYEEQDVAVFGAVYNFLQRGPKESLLAFVAPFMDAQGQWPQAETFPRQPKVAKARTMVARKH